MTAIAVRTTADTEDFRTIEGLAFPFAAKDTYDTFFSARTDFSWGLFPDTVPGTTNVEPRFIRPMTFQHGFDPYFGLTRIGGWSPVRIDGDGVWVRARIDKQPAYYATRIAPLLDADALGFSGGSVEHSVRIDLRSGEILAWPAIEVALTNVESNPLAQVASPVALRVVASERRQPVLRVVGGAPTGFAGWQAARAEWDARSGIANLLRLATRGPMATPSDGDRTWVRSMLTKRRDYLARLAERFGIDYRGAMLGDAVEAAAARMERVIAAKLAATERALASVAAQ